MENMKKSKWSFLANLDVIVASVILAILIILTFAGVIWRYVFHAPFTWLEEVQTSCMVWITFAAAGAAFRNGNHVALSTNSRFFDIWRYQRSWAGLQN